MNINNMSVAKVNNMLGEAVCLPSYATMLLSVVKSSESPWWAHKKEITQEPQDDEAGRPSRGQASSKFSIG